MNYYQNLSYYDRSLYINHLHNIMYYLINKIYHIHYTYLLQYILLSLYILIYILYIYINGLLHQKR